jgi:Tol biopolymer transport system component/DNA-binding winged helix-turn-helix (wHTH) protein
MEQMAGVLTSPLETFEDENSSIQQTEVAMSGSPQIVTPAEKLPRYRFGTFELDASSGELRRNGVKLRLQEQPFLVLRTLLESAGTIVAREDLHAALWPADTFVDFDTSLNTAIKRLREVLGDSADVPVFIETIPRRGYRFLAPMQVYRNGGIATLAPTTAEEKEAAPSSKRKFRPAIVAMFLLLACLVAGAVVKHTLSISPPRVVDSTQLTFDGLSKSGLTVSGGQIYFNKRLVNQTALLRLPMGGGNPVVLASASPGLYLGDVSAEGKLLLGEPQGNLGMMKGRARLKVMDQTSGSIEDLGIDADFASWAPGGKIVFAKMNDIFLSNANGSDVRKLLTAPGAAFHMRFSPDGTRLRFTVGGRHTEQDSLWEARADGSGLHEILTSMTAFPNRCCGEWSPDGRYYFFQTQRNGASRIWVQAQRHPFWTKDAAPVELTTVPPNFYMGGVSQDGKKLYVTVAQPRAELVRYDTLSKQLVPFLSGISAGGVETSRDGSMVTYIRYPDETLWRSKADGSEAAQITGPSLVAALPHWSPDGRRIAFSGSQPRRPWNIYLIPVEGGPAEQVTNGGMFDLDPTWSADGSTLAFAQLRMEDNEAKVSIQMLDVASRKAKTLNGSEGLCCPRWSPDGKYLVASHLSGDEMLLYEFATGKWRVLDKNVGPTAYMAWSSDSKEILFDTLDANEPGMYRIRVSDSRLQNVTPISGIRRYYSSFGPWSGITPDGSPLLVRDISNEEIYELQLEIP